MKLNVNKKEEVVNFETTKKIEGIVNTSLKVNRCSG